MGVPTRVFRGVVLAINCRDAAEVDRTYDELAAIPGVTLHGKPVDLSFGGRGFEWSAPRSPRRGERD